MALSKSEREEFLAEPHIAALSVNAGDSRGPLTVPIWNQYTPGREPWGLTGAGSRKTKLIEPGTEEQLVELARRYLPPHRVDAFLDYARSELGSQVVIYLQPQHWISA